MPVILPEHRADWGNFQAKNELTDDPVSCFKRWLTVHLANSNYKWIVSVVGAVTVMNPTGETP